MNRILAVFLTAALIAPSLPAVSAENDTETITYNYSYDQTNGYEAAKAHTRQMEKLDRGLVAVKSGNGVYLSWRLFDSEDAVYGSADSNVEFVVYCDGKEVAVVKGKTNYTDRTAGTSYTVAAIINGEEWPQCKPVTVMDNNYFDITLDKPDDVTLADGVSYPYTVGDASCGDLDGDGEYEIIVKWDCNPKDSSQGGFTGNVLLDAYKQNGTKLWRVDLGQNIRSGAHYVQFLVYDFDGDGKAEMTCQTAPGSKDTTGGFVTRVSSQSDISSADNTVRYVNDGGHIIEGPEYLTIFNGNGVAVDTINYPVIRYSASDWNDNYGNRCSRFLATVGYLDGINPYAVYWRGYYDHKGRTGVAAMSFNGKRLSVDYIFDTRKGRNGYTEGNEKYTDQGNHSMLAADVDNDGKDEFGSGALWFEVNSENKLVPKWCSYRQHGDAHHIGDYDPTHPGLEYFSVHEHGWSYNSADSYAYTGDNIVIDDNGNEKKLDYGMTVYDAATGEELKHNGVPTTRTGRNKPDTGRGMMANVGSGGFYQIIGEGNFQANGNGAFTEISNGMSSNFRIFWDGDVYDELLDGVNITSWNGSGMGNIFKADGCIQINGTKANPALQADLFGDWREELVYPTSDNTKLRVFTTTTPTDYKIKTLMHDPVYRSGVAAEQTAYNQPPHVGFYMGKEDFLDKTLIKDDENQSRENEKIITASKVRNEIGNQATVPDTTKVSLNYYQYMWGLAYFGFENIADFDPDKILKAEIIFTPTDRASQDRTFNFKLLPANNNWEAGVVKSNSKNPTIGDAIVSQSLRTINIKVNEELTFDITDYIKGFQKGTSEISIIAAVDGAAVMSVMNNPKIVLTLEPTAVTPDPNKTPRPTHNPDATDTPNVTPSPSPTLIPTPATLPPSASPTICSPSPTAAPTVSPSPSATPTSTPTVIDRDQIVVYNYEAGIVTIHAWREWNGVSVIFAAYDENGRLTGIRERANITLHKGDQSVLADENLRQLEFLEDAHTVKVFVWNSLDNPVPLANAEKFEQR